MLVPSSTHMYLYSWLLNNTVITSDIPEAIDPFLLVLMLNELT